MKLKNIISKRENFSQNYEDPLNFEVRKNLFLSYL
jgi:hypothetical protein